MIRLRTGHNASSGGFAAFSLGAATQYFVHGKHLKDECGKAHTALESISNQMDELKSEGATNEQTE